MTEAPKTRFTVWSIESFTAIFSLGKPISSEICFKGSRHIRPGITRCLGRTGMLEYDNLPFLLRYNTWHIPGSWQKMEGQEELHIPSNVHPVAVAGIQKIYCHHMYAHPVPNLWLLCIPTQWSDASHVHYRWIQWSTRSSPSLQYAHVWMQAVLRSIHISTLLSM